jgi:prepilin-type N-terminal cleavage/methylation domain-containing protein
MKRQAGFTLIEVTIALAVMGVMVVGILTLLRGAGSSASRQAAQATQNGEIRTGVQTLQNSLSNADRPLLYVPATNTSGGWVAEGNEIIYTRTDDRGPTQDTIYAAERVRLVDNEGNTAAAGEPGKLVLQRKSYTSASDREAEMVDLKDRTSPAWQNAPSKVILSNVNSSKSIFSFMARAGQQAPLLGTSSADTTTNLEDVGLVDVSLISDQDGSEDRYQGASIDTSIYLRKAAGRTTNPTPTGCD